MIIVIESKFAGSSLFARKSISYKILQTAAVVSISKINTFCVFCASMKPLSAFVDALFADSSISMESIGRFALAFVPIHQVDALSVTVAFVRAQNAFIYRRNAMIAVTEEAGFARAIVSASSIFVMSVFMATMRPVLALVDFFLADDSISKETFLTKDDN